MISKYMKMMIQIICHQEMHIETRDNHYIPFASAPSSQHSGKSKITERAKGSMIDVGHG